MNENQEPAGTANGRRRWLGIGGLLGAGVLAGAILASTGLAGAATSSSSSPSSTASHQAGDPAQVAHGPGETLLSGSDLSAVTDAAKAAVPGASVIRVETDSNGGAAYEAHMQKADGSYVSVQFNTNLKVTGTVAGFGPGGAAAQPSA